jgi:hypothetical protein
MAPYPWLTVNRTKENNITVRLHRRSFSDVLPHGSNVYSSLISLIGTRQKAKHLSRALGYADPFEQHGQIRLSGRVCPSDSQPTIFLDCEIASAASGTGEKEQRSSSSCLSEWNCGSSLESFSDQVYHYVLAPLSSVICYFAADLGGSDGVVCILATQAVLPRAHSLPSNALPHVLVVVETRSKSFNSQKALSDLRTKIVQKMMELKAYTTPEDAMRDLSERFRAIHIADIPKASSQAVRSTRISKRLATLQDEVYWARRNSRYLFRLQHLDALAVRLVSNLCSTPTYFDFLRESRPLQFDDTQLKSHIDEFLTLLPGSQWLWHVLAPVVASACCLASYPPGSHCKIYSTLFSWLC